jgi:hypothetical protein
VTRAEQQCDEAAAIHCQGVSRLHYSAPRCAPCDSARGSTAGLSGVTSAPGNQVHQLDRGRIALELPRSAVPAARRPPTRSVYGAEYLVAEVLTGSKLWRSRTRLLATRVWAPRSSVDRRIVMTRCAISTTEGRRTTRPCKLSREETQPAPLRYALSLREDRVGLANLSSSLRRGTRAAEPARGRAPWRRRSGRRCIARAG